MHKVVRPRLPPRHSDSRPTHSVQLNPPHPPSASPPSKINLLRLSLAAPITQPTRAASVHLASSSSNSLRPILALDSVRLGRRRSSSQHRVQALVHLVRISNNNNLSNSSNQRQAVLSVDLGQVNRRNLPLVQPVSRLDVLLRLSDLTSYRGRFRHWHYIHIWSAKYPANNGCLWPASSTDDSSLWWRIWCVFACNCFQGLSFDTTQAQLIMPQSHPFSDSLKRNLP